MLKALLYFTVLLQCGLSLSQGDDLRLARLVTQATRQCLEDGDYCWDPEECCTGECSHHWPPTTTPVFGQCGPVPECQGADMWCKEEWGDAQCCEGLTCVPVDVPEGLTEWGVCLLM